MNRSASGQRWRDGVALIVVLADLATYVALLHLGSVGFIRDPRAMASIVLISTVLLCPMSASYGQQPGLWAGFIGLIGAAALGLGIATLVGDGWGTLTALMIAMGVIWLLSATHHVMRPAPAPARAQARDIPGPAAHGEQPTGSVLVAYASRHGFTQGIADRLAATLRAAGQTVDERPLASVRDLSGYDAFVIGSAAYIGQWLKPATDFVRRNRDALGARPLWLFSSGPLGTAATDPKGRDALEASEPKQFAEFRTLLQPRGARVFFGGLDPSRLGGGERMVRATPVGRQLLPEGDFRDWPAIEGWAGEIARELDAVPAPTN
jgi:menaquinone-dependent protoporphyrinogen oxidase